MGAHLRRWGWLWCALAIGACSLNPQSEPPGVEGNDGDGFNGGSAGATGSGGSSAGGGFGGGMSGGGMGGASDAGPPRDDASVTDMDSGAPDGAGADGGADSGGETDASDAGLADAMDALAE